MANFRLFSSIATFPLSFSSAQDSGVARRLSSLNCRRPPKEEYQAVLKDNSQTHLQFTKKIQNELIFNQYLEIGETLQPNFANFN